MGTQHSSILDIFLERVRTDGPGDAALVKRDGSYQPVTWTAMAADSRAIARALIAGGVAQGDRVALICQTRLEWVLADLGILGAGAVTVPLYPSNLPDECQYVTDHSDAVLVFAEDAGQVEKLVAERTRLPGVRRVVQMTGTVAPGDGWVVGMEDFVAAGAEVPDEDVDRRAADLTADSILTIIYTSGTTGRPKGVVLTHANMLYEASCNREIGLVSAEDVQLLFLPLAHVFAKVIEVGWFASGHVIAFAESIETIKQNLQEVRPTIMAGVPRVYEKFYGAVVEKGLAEPGFKAKLLGAAMELSRRNGELEMQGKTLGLAESLKMAVLKRLVFTKVHQRIQAALGGRMRAMLSGGAPLPNVVAWFLRDAGIVIVEGYGLTETSAGTCVNREGSARIGTVGPAIPRTEIRIATDGEILVRGQGVMRGYWKDPEATAEVIVDGWFHTGDIGVLDPDGHVRITDRKKDIIVTAGGKNVAPQNIENLIKANELISHVVVHGDRRKYLTALITLEEEALGKLAKRRGLPNGSYAALTGRPEIVAAVQAIVDECNAQLPSHETIKRFHVLDQDFSQETGELTPKLSVRRRVVFDRHREIFDGLYDTHVLA